MPPSKTAAIMEPVNALLQPFEGYLANPRFAPRVVGPPRATLTPLQKAAARDDPLSFRFTAGRKAGLPRDEALEWLRECCHQDVLFPIGPAVLVYRQQWADFSAIGILGDLSLDAYQAGRVKPHERTIAKTERKMADYMKTTRLYGNPPVTAFRPDPAVDEAIAMNSSGPPTSTFETVDGISHSLWVVAGDDAESLCRQITADLYITDGHHRLAAAASVATDEGRSGARIPSGVFSADQFRLRSFARCINDPTIDPNEAITRLESQLEAEEVTSVQALPTDRFEFGAKISDRYFRLRIPPGLIPEDHYASLNTNLLLELVLRPVFRIEDPRQDRRIKFVADLGDIQERCSQADAWFLPYPLEAGDVMTVADAGLTMPAKSTWFAPKLPSGIVIRPVEQL